MSLLAPKIIDPLAASIFFISSLVYRSTSGASGATKLGPTAHPIKFIVKQKITKVLPLAIILKRHA